MTLDEAITKNIKMAELQERLLSNADDSLKEIVMKYATEYRQLAEWLRELKEAKRLLKAAVEDMYNSVNDVHCKYCSKWHTDQCQGTSHLDCYIENKFKWRHEDEALALIGEDTNVPASADDTNVGHKSGGWISCEDRLPEPDTMVIVASYGSDIVIPEDSETVEECCKRLKKECVRVTLGFIGSDGWYDCEYCPLIVTPSFWQPLPEPPKE